MVGTTPTSDECVHRTRGRITARHVTSAHRHSAANRDLTTSCGYRPLLCFRPEAPRRQSRGDQRVPEIPGFRESTALEDRAGQSFIPFRHADPSSLARSRRFRGFRGIWDREKSRKSASRCGFTSIQLFWSVLRGSKNPRNLLNLRETAVELHACEKSKNRPLRCSTQPLTIIGSRSRLEIGCLVRLSRTFGDSEIFSSDRD